MAHITTNADSCPCKDKPGRPILPHVGSTTMQPLPHTQLIWTTHYKSSDIAPVPITKEILAMPSLEKWHSSIHHQYHSTLATTLSHQDLFYPNSKWYRLLIQSHHGAHSVVHHASQPRSMGSSIRHAGCHMLCWHHILPSPLPATMLHTWLCPQCGIGINTTWHTIIFSLAHWAWPFLTPSNWACLCHIPTDNTSRTTTPGNVSKNVGMFLEHTFSYARKHATDPLAT